ncbi:MAG: flagellar biosynthesis anti-sigma factor FlgM [Spirochaetota bacterium]
MILDKIGNIHKIFDAKKTKSVNKTNNVNNTTDSIHISNEGLKAADEARITQMVKETSDVRREKVEQIKKQIQDGTYDRHLDDKVLSIVANKLINGIFSE